MDEIVGTHNAAFTAGADSPERCMTWLGTRYRVLRLTRQGGLPSGGRAPHSRVGEEQPQQVLIGFGAESRERAHDNASGPAYRPLMISASAGWPSSPTTRYDKPNRSCRAFRSARI